MGDGFLVVLSYTFLQFLMAEIFSTFITNFFDEFLYIWFSTTPYFRFFLCSSPLLGAGVRDFVIIIIGCGSFDIIIIGFGGFDNFYQWEEARKSLFESPRICLSTSLSVERLSVSSLRSFCSKNLSTSSSWWGLRLRHRGEEAFSLFLSS